MIKENKSYIFLFSLFIFLLVCSMYYFNFIKITKEKHESQKYISVAKQMQNRVKEMINTKEKSLVAIALSLAKDQQVSKFIEEKKIPNDYYKTIIKNYKKDTLYKNIWIEVVDKDLNCLFRSWSDKKNDNLKKTRKDLVKVIKTKKVTIGVSAGKYNLSLKAMVPIMANGKLIGVLEVIAHFNSIAKQMEKFNIESVVILSKKMTEELTNPFNKLYIDGHYVANYDVNKKLLAHIKEIGIENFLDNSYKIDGDYLVSVYPLKCIHDKIVGYYLMFTKVEEISTLKVELLSFKLLIGGVIFVLILIGIASFLMLYYMRKQKLYYKAIVDSTTNIVLVNEKENIVDANNEFFYYFSDYNSLDEFKKEHQCICDFFIQEDGYLYKEVDGVYWVDYLLEKRGRSRVVKLNINDNIYYFSVSASKIFTRYSTVLTDITKQENLKRELKTLSLTDTLTEIGNRRFFDHKLQEELQRSSRFVYDISLVMFDIDHFKKINDEFGHDAGDDVLKGYTKLIKSQLRGCDIFCRVGGEEFMLILPHVNLENAEQIAEKLRKNVEDHEVEIKITMSFGVIQVSQHEEIETMYKRVDTLLYEAKESGRNKVVTG